MNIIKAKPEDVDILYPLSWRTFYESFHHLNKKANMDAYMDNAFAREKLLTELQNENSEFYFAKMGEVVAGYVKLNRKDAQTEFKDDACLEVERIYIDSSFQSNGMGTELINKVKEIARTSGVTYIWLGVWEKNPAAIRFYERHGFKIFSTHEFIMGDEVQMDKLMICKLS